MDLGFAFDVGCTTKCKWTEHDGLLFCSGCHEIVYCSNACAEKDWPIHMSYCKGVTTVIGRTIYPLKQNNHDAMQLRNELKKK